MKLKKSERGFSFVEFTDLYGAECSLQKSSLATEDAIWFGVDINGSGENLHRGRMHLSRVQVAELLPLLQHFADTGKLPQEIET